MRARLMTIQQLVQCYERGAITPHHLVVDLLGLVSSANADAAMGALPGHLHSELRRFLEEYVPGKMLRNHGPIPSPESIERAREWLNAKQRLGAGTR
jgi:hypothetical protein